MPPERYEVELMGVTAMPPRAPMAAEMAKARRIMRPVLTPERLAAPGSLEVAVICLPIRVRLVRRYRPTSTRIMSPITHRLCGKTATLPMKRAWSPVKAGTLLP